MRFAVPVYLFLILSISLKFVSCYFRTQFVRSSASNLILMQMVWIIHIVIYILFSKSFYFIGVIFQRRNVTVFDAISFITPLTTKRYFSPSLTLLEYFCHRKWKQIKVTQRCFHSNIDNLLFKSKASYAPISTVAVSSGVQKNCSAKIDMTSTVIGHKLLQYIHVITYNPIYLNKPLVPHWLLN